LALFGRRPSERVERPVIPAAENLHKSGLPHCEIAGGTNRPHALPGALAIRLNFPKS
jgi:hypothetical protein